MAAVHPGENVREPLLSDKTAKQAKWPAVLITGMIASLALMLVLACETVATAQVSAPRAALLRSSLDHIAAIITQRLAWAAPLP